MTILTNILVVIEILACIIGWFTCIYILCTNKINTKKKHDNISLCLLGLSCSVILYGIISNELRMAYIAALTLTSLSFLVWKRGDTYKTIVCLNRLFKNH